MKKKIWMPLYIGDYLADTIGLSNEEHGAYLRSIMQYWSKRESLSDEELRGICGRVFERVSRFFVMEGYRWHHKRIDAELSKAETQQRIAREKAMKGVVARRAMGILPPEQHEREAV